MSKHQKYREQLKITLWQEIKTNTDRQFPHLDEDQRERFAMHRYLSASSDATVSDLSYSIVQIHSDNEQLLLKKLAANL